MTTTFTFDPRKTEIQIAAVQITIDHIQRIRSPKVVCASILIVPDGFQLFEMSFDTRVIMTDTWVSRLVNAKIGPSHRAAAFFIDLGCHDRGE